MSVSSGHHAPMAFFQMPPVFHGVLLHFAVVLVASVAIGFTSPTSWLRYVALAAQLLILGSMDASWGAGLRWSFAASFLAQHTVSSILQYCTTALLTHWSYEHGGPQRPAPYLQKTREDKSIVLQTGTPGDASVKDQVEERRLGLFATAFDRLAFGYNTIQAYRMLNTPYEARSAPLFSKSSPGYVPAKGRFLFTTSVRFAICYLLLDLMRQNSSDSSSKELMSPSHIPIFRRLSEVTVAELAARAAVTAAAYVAGQALLQAIYSFLALVSVGTGCSSPIDWRPLFGSFLDAYTIRRFWNSTWHQLSRIKFIAVAHLITYKWLGCPEKSFVGRYVLVASVFIISGIQHFCGDRAEGVGWLDSGNFTFFATQLLGVALEDQIQKLWSSFGSKRFSLMARIIGHVWVFCFMAWSMPANIYASMAARADVGENPLVPWSVIDYMTRVRNGTSSWLEL